MGRPRTAWALVTTAVLAALGAACTPSSSTSAAGEEIAATEAPVTEAPITEVPVTAVPVSEALPTQSPGAGVVAATDAVFATFSQGGPGCAVGVRDGAAGFQQAYGAADLASGAALTPDSVFDIGSVSKQITAGAVMLLVLQQRVDLEADVHTYLPELPRYTQTVTVGDLVHHSSGLPDYIDQIEADYEEVTTADDALAVLSDGLDGPAFTPGTEFEYSNTNYFLLGQLVEAVTGETLVDFAAQEVFSPLGMDHSLFRDDQHDGVLLPGQAAGHAEAGPGGWEVVWSDWQQTGDGAVHTTVGDLLRWSGVFLGAPATEGPGSQAWRDLMLTAGPVPDEDGYDYGGGVVLDHSAGGLVLSHSGAWIGYSSALIVEPPEDLAVAVACNVDDLDAEALADAVHTVWSQP